MSMTFSPEKFLDLFARKWPELLEQLLNHINATTLALLISLAVGVPLGVLITRNRAASSA